jgi:hypothetical protein
VHVDRYKRILYLAAETDPFLGLCTTEDPTASRFHACDRYDKCGACRSWFGGERVNKDKRIVHVNAIEVKTAAWAIEHQTFIENLSSAAKGEGPWPLNIVSRISTRLKVRTAHSPVTARYPNCKLWSRHSVRKRFHLIR